MSKTFTKTIKTDSEDINKALAIMFTVYSDQLGDLLTQIAANRSVTVEPSITISDDENEVTVEAFSTDKGTVIAPDGETVSLVEYTDLKVGERYVKDNKNAFWLYLKAEDGLDDKVGHFRTMKEAIENINSTQVDEAIKTLLASKEEKKEENELKVVK